MGLTLLFESISPEIKSDELLARYLFSNRHFAKTTGRVKPGAFLKPPKDEYLSVYRISGISESAIWELGQEYAAKPSKRKLVARGDVSVSDVLAQDLTVTDEQPQPRHAGIRGWPLNKSSEKSIAQKIAAEATLTIFPSKSDAK